MYNFSGFLSPVRGTGPPADRIQSFFWLTGNPAFGLQSLIGYGRMDTFCPASELKEQACQPDSDGRVALQLPANRRREESCESATARLALDKGTSRCQCKCHDVLVC